MKSIHYLSAIAFSAFMLTSCDKSEISGPVLDEHSLLVSIENMDTRSALYDNVKTEWCSDDIIKVFTTDGMSATFKCSEILTGVNRGKAKFVIDAQDDGFSISNFAAAYYPGNVSTCTCSYDSEHSKATVTATVPATQTYASGSFGNGSAPMVSNVKSGDQEILFKNAFGAVRLSLYEADAATLSSLSLASASTKLNGTFKFILSNQNDLDITYPTSDGTKTVSMSFDPAQTLSSTQSSPSIFYVVVPGTANNEKVTLSVNTGTYTFSRCFTSNNQTYASSDPNNKYNKVKGNHILQMGTLEVGRDALTSIGIDSWDTGLEETPELN